MASPYYPTVNEWTQHDLDEWGQKARQAQLLGKPDEPVVIPADKLLALLEWMRMARGL